MQEKANVSLSAFEQQLVADSNWILTKNRIIEKVYLLFGQLSELYKHHVATTNLAGVVTTNEPKIARGENYEGLPYVMLDYPRCFGKNDVFAIRTFFWWGHFFSITLHLKGTYLQANLPALLAAQNELQLQKVWVNVSNQEWEHHFRSSNMQLLNNQQEPWQQKEVLKLAFLCSFEDWEKAETLLYKKFQFLLQTLQVI